MYLARGRQNRPVAVRSIVYNTDDDSVLLYVDGITIKSTAKCGKGNTFLSLGKSTVDNVGIQGSVDSVFVYNIY